MSLKSKVTLMLILLFSVNSLAQVGIGTDSPNSDAILDMVSSDKGILAPRVALTATNAVAPLSAHVAGMMVYNTATAGTAPNNVTPGYYYNDGTKWLKMADSGFTLTSIDLKNIGNNNHITSDAGNNNGTSLGTGTDNIAIGSSALKDIATGRQNVAIGTNALEGNTGTVQQATALGYNAGQDFTNSWSTLVGYEAGKGASGQTLIALGYQAGLNGKQGIESIAIGYQAMANQTDSSPSLYNIAIGDRALINYNPAPDPNTVENSQGRNIAIGSKTFSRGRGHFNIALGENALSDTGSAVISNIGIGFEAGKNSNGRRNIFIGEYAGDNTIVTGNDNIILGNRITVPNLAGNGQINIGNRIIGDSAGNIGIGTSSPQATLHVNNSRSASITSTNHAITVGETIGPNLAISGNGILARNNGAQANLFIQGGATAGNTLINSSIGNVGIAIPIPAAKFHVGTTADASLTSTNHAITVGLTTGQNMAIDNNEILARNNGAIGTLFLQNEGTTILNSVSGNVGIGTDSPTEKLDVNGTARLRNVPVMSGTSDLLNISSAGRVTKIPYKKMFSPAGETTNPVLFSNGASTSAVNIPISTFGVYEVTISGFNVGNFQTFADKYVIAYANNVNRVSVSHYYSVSTIGASALNSPTTTAGPITVNSPRGFYSFTTSPSGGSNAIIITPSAGHALRYQVVPLN